MRRQIRAALVGLLALGACGDATGPEASAAPQDDAAFVTAMAASVGELGQYLGPALLRIRERSGQAATAQCEEMERLRLQLRERERAGDEEGAAQLRLQLRQRAAAMIQAGLGDGVAQQLLRENEQVMAQLRLRLHANTGSGEQQFLQLQLQLQERARQALAQGRVAEALELAARVREQLRVHAGAHPAPPGGVAVLNSILTVGDQDQDQDQDRVRDPIQLRLHDCEPTCDSLQVRQGQGPKAPLTAVGGKR